MKLIISFIFIACSLSNAATNYVRAGATGAANGTDWVNAWTNLPAYLTRGDIYMVADGAYPYYYARTDEDGTNLITIKKATSSDHGIDTGWNSAYGDGVASFDRMRFSKRFWLIDGVTGGGSSSWTNGHGFRVIATNSTSDIFVQTSSGSGNITFNSVAFGNDEWPTPGCDVIVYAVDGRPTNITFTKCYFFHIGDVGFTLYNVTDWTWDNCYFNRIDRYGDKAGICGTGINHGAGWELGSFGGETGGITNITIKNSFISDIEGTGWIGIYSTNVTDGISIYNNVFTIIDNVTNTWGNGIIYNTSAATNGIKNILIANNTFIGVTNGPFIGLTSDIGGSRANTNSCCNAVINNLFWGSRSDGEGAGYSRSFNAVQTSMTGNSNEVILVSNPVNSSYGLLASLTGTNLSQYFTTDITGKTRTTWDIGAYEYGRTRRAVVRMRAE